MTSTILPRLTVAAAAAVAGAGFAMHACGQARAEVAAPASSAVVVVKATHACFSDMVRITGFLVPRVEAIVNLDAEGYRISDVLVGEGDLVTSGQVLARLTRLDGGQSGGGQGGGAQQQQQQQRPATMTLKAPTAGMVIKSTAKVGAVASPLPLPPPMGPEPLFRIMVRNEMELEVEVPSIHVPKLNPGQTARVEVEDGRELTGRVRQVPAEIDRRTQLGRIRLSVDNDRSLRVGMFARATIDAARSCGVSIPRAAVSYQTEGPTVQVLRDRTVETRRVREGLYSDSSVEIREGIKEGDIVVANAGNSLHDGDQVKPIFADDFGQPGVR